MVQGKDPSVKDLTGVLSHEVPYLFQTYVKESHGRDMRVVVVVSQKLGQGRGDSEVWKLVHQCGRGRRAYQGKGRDCHCILWLADPALPFLSCLQDKKAVFAMVRKSNTDSVQVTCMSVSLMRQLPHHPSSWPINHPVATILSLQMLETNPMSIIIIRSLTPSLPARPAPQANLSHGGTGEVVTGRHLDAEALAVRICTLLDMDVAGVDLLFNDEYGYVCCEVWINK